VALASVLVAAYKPTHLREALESALGQSESDIEVVVVDDSGRGSVHEIVDRLDDRRIRYIRNGVNLGPAGSYRRAIAESSAPVLGILNDDDLWEPVLVERLLEALDSASDVVLAFGDHWVSQRNRRDLALSIESSRKWGRDVLVPGVHQPFRRLALVDKSVPMAVAALFRRAAIGDTAIPSGVGGAYDYFLAYRLCRDGGGAVYVPERLATWRLHEGNLTGVGSAARAEEAVAVYALMSQDRALAGIREEMRTDYSEALWTLATRNLRGGRRRRAIRAAVGAVRQHRYRAALLIPAALIPRRFLAASAMESQ
jgi:glycosyltransferase involved in cell wall biosynthesis